MLTAKALHSWARIKIFEVRMEIVDCIFKQSDDDRLIAENEALKSENERLKSLSLVKLLEQKDSIIVKQEECNDWLRAENARLRTIIEMLDEDYNELKLQIQAIFKQAKN